MRLGFSVAVGLMVTCAPAAWAETNAAWQPNSDPNSCTVAGAGSCSFHCEPGSLVGVTRMASGAGASTAECGGLTASCSVPAGACADADGPTAATGFGVCQATGANIRTQCFGT